MMLKIILFVSSVINFFLLMPLFYAIYLCGLGGGEFFKYPIVMFDLKFYSYVYTHLPLSIVTHHQFQTLYGLHIGAVAIFLLMV